MPRARFHEAKRRGKIKGKEKRTEDSPLMENLDSGALVSVCVGRLQGSVFFFFF